MTKREIVIKIAEQTGLTQLVVSEVVQKTFDTIVEALKSNDRIELRNFGVFYVKRRQARKGRNPNKPQEVFHIPPCNLPVFKPGKEMKEACQSNIS